MLSSLIIMKQCDGKAKEKEKSHPKLPDEPWELPNSKRKEGIRLPSFRRNKIPRHGSKGCCGVLGTIDQELSNHNKSIDPCFTNQQQSILSMSFRRKAFSDRNVTKVFPRSKTEKHMNEKVPCLASDNMGKIECKRGWSIRGLFTRRNSVRDFNSNKPPTSSTSSSCSSPQDYLEMLLKPRGCSTKRLSSLNCGYYQEPSEIQEASWNQYILDLVTNNDITTLRKMFKSGISCNPSTYFGVTLAHYVCKVGRVQILELMIEYGCDIRVADSNGRTPLHEACDRVEPDFPLIDMIAKQDSGLFFMEDVEGKVPLEYVPHLRWSVWNYFLKSRIEVHWPRCEFKMFGEQLQTIVDRSRHTSSGMKSSIPISKVRLIASGKSSNLARRDHDTVTTTSATRDSMSHQTVQDWWIGMNVEHTESYSMRSSNLIKDIKEQDNVSPVSSLNCRESNASNTSSRGSSKMDQLVGEIVCIMEDFNVFQTSGENNNTNKPIKKISKGLDVTTHDRMIKQIRIKTPCKPNKCRSHHDFDKQSHIHFDHQNIDHTDISYDLSESGSDDEGSDGSDDNRVVLTDTYEIDVNKRDTDSVSTITQKKQRNNNEFNCQRLIL